MTRHQIEGAVTILCVAATPWVSWAAGETSLRATIVMSIIQGLGAWRAWLSQRKR